MNERRFSCAVPAGSVFVSLSSLLKLYYSVNCKCPNKPVLFIGELPIEMLREPAAVIPDIGESNCQQIRNLSAFYRALCPL